MERPGTRSPVIDATLGRTRRSLVLRHVPVLVATVLAGKAVAGQASVAVAQAGTPEPREVEATVQGFYDAFNTGDVDALDDVLAPDWVDFPPPPGTGTDAENFKQTILTTLIGFPDIRFEIQDFIVEGGQVAVRSIATGTHEGDFYGIPATGRAVEFQTIDIHRVESDRIVETYHVEDLLSVLIQVGAFPTPATPEAGTPAP